MVWYMGTKGKVERAVYTLRQEEEIEILHSDTTTRLRVQEDSNLHSHSRGILRSLTGPVYCLIELMGLRLTN